MNEIEYMERWLAVLLSEPCADQMAINALKAAITALEVQEADRWIPIAERMPEHDYIRNIWVTATKYGYGHRIAMQLNWGCGRFLHPINGKEISSAWKILAWKLPEHPEPYDPLADKLQKVLDREHDRISGGKSK
jgi:hypothetical protein